MKPVQYKTPEELALATKKLKVETLSLIKNLKRKKPKTSMILCMEFMIIYLLHLIVSIVPTAAKLSGPGIVDKDIDRLSKHLKMKPAAFIETYVETDEDNDYVFRNHPCPFLLPDNYCMVYENRPKACRDYPHTNRKRFVQILDLSHKNCETCPVVFEVFEQLRQNIRSLL